MGAISDFVSERVIGPLILIVETKGAKMSEEYGDIQAKDDNSKKACDNYIVALFKYAALGEAASAQRVNEKIKRNFGPSYVPSKRDNWNIMRRRINNIASSNPLYDPRDVIDTYLSSSMPQANLEGLL